jgi:hypothetical protein
MNQSEFVESIEKTYKDGVELIKIKNADYAVFDNPFKNFESANVVGIGTDQAILVRVLDKISRIGNLIRREAQVKDEKVTDTILDCVNYLAILKSYLERNDKQ